MNFQIKKATRQAVKPLIGLYSESGCGKTYSALLLARGMAGKDGKIVMIDSESGRGSLYADVLAGGYDVIDLGEPFSPQRYIAAISAVESSGAKIGIIDSISHEWEGIGGVLDMASQNEERSGKPGLHCWKQPKLEHAKMMLKLLQSPIPWIVCLRAKHKSKQQKNERGKTEIVKDDFVTPIQADDFIFEMTAHAAIQQDHSILLTKCSHPNLRHCFPGTGPIQISHGEMITKWCNSASGESVNTVADTKRSLWTLTEAIHGGSKDKLRQWLIDDVIIAPDDQLEAMEEKQLTAVLAAAKKKLSYVESLKKVE